MNESGTVYAGEGRTVPMEENKPEYRTQEVLQHLPTMSAAQLAALWERHVGTTIRIHPVRRSLILPVLAHRIQELLLDDPIAAKRVANRSRSLDASLNCQDARRRFKAGTRLVRAWRGKQYEVVITASAYVYRDRAYQSLSQIACEITGTRWSGPAFFGTKRKPASQ